MASQLVALKTKCQQTAASLKAEHLEELAGLRAQQTEELSKLEVETQSCLGELRVQHAQEASKLRVALEEASRRREKLRQDRDLSADQFLESQREGARLQRQFADARQEVLEISAHLKSSSLQHSQRNLDASMGGGRSRSMTQLGRSAPPSPATADGSLVGDRSQVDTELQTMRRRCKALEKECAKTHDALEKKQAECLRWRKRSFEHGNHSNQSTLSGKSGPFTLGPVDNGADLKLLSPNGSRTL